MGLVLIYILFQLLNIYNVSTTRVDDDTTGNLLSTSTTGNLDTNSISITQLDDDDDDDDGTSSSKVEIGENSGGSGGGGGGGGDWPVDDGGGASGDGAGGDRDFLQQV